MTDKIVVQLPFTTQVIQVMNKKSSKGSIDINYAIFNLPELSKKMGNSPKFQETL